MTEEDPTAVDPNEAEPDDDGPVKPLEIPSEPVQPPTDQEEEEQADEFLTETEAADDPTVDDAEAEEQPHDPSTLDIAED